MKSWTTLVRREFLEHRVAFVYVPAAMVSVFLATIVLAGIWSEVSVEHSGMLLTPPMFYEGLYFIVVALWTAYLLIGMLFYFADSFSADRRNNAMLFWKSMPQSDLKILTSKMLAAATVFPLLILGWLVVTGAIAYLAVVLFAVRVPDIAAPDIVTALGSWLNISLASVVFIVLSLLWYAPFLAWVAGLSTAFRRWSIPLAFVIPAGAMIIEIVFTFRGAPVSRVWNFLTWRLSGFFGEEEVVPLLLSGQPASAPRMIADMLGGINWPALLAGLAFAALATWAASEYRRRRI